MVVFPFPGGSARSGVPVVCALCFFLSALSFILFLLSGDHLFSELKDMTGDADQVAGVRNRRASIFLPINPSKIITAVSGSMHHMP